MKRNKAIHGSLPSTTPNEIRFDFGKNWARYLRVLDEERIREAERSLVRWLGRTSLEGMRFLDIGSGSGLFSLAAHRLGAIVHSFDYDATSVKCAQELKRRLPIDSPRWTIEQGSALDRLYLQSLGTFDIVYSWGVLHHTGAMWDALENVSPLVAVGGQLFIGIYNDQGPVSSLWHGIKKIYCSSRVGKFATTLAVFPFFAMRGIVVDVLRLRSPLTRYREYRKNRGMSIFHDWTDWLGGFPFEVAKPEEVIMFYRSRGFVLDNLKTCGGLSGCNEFVFTRVTMESDSH